jgi:hypothetical protein
MTESQKEKLDEILEKDSGLSGWEMDFIENMDKNWRERNMSEKQDSTLSKIWERQCNS